MAHLLTLLTVLSICHLGTCSEHKGYTMKGHKCSTMCEIPKGTWSSTPWKYLYCKSVREDAHDHVKLNSRWHHCSHRLKAHTGDTDHPKGFSCPQAHLNVVMNLPWYNRFTSSGMFCPNYKLQVNCMLKGRFHGLVLDRQTTWKSLQPGIRGGKGLVYNACKDIDNGIDPSIAQHLGEDFNPGQGVEIIGLKDRARDIHRGTG